MIFSSFQFLFFFLTVIAMLIVAPIRFRKLILLAASYIFYAYWDPRFTALILASTIIDFAIGHLLYRAEAVWRRKLLLFASLAANLGILGFFKYYNFFVDSASTIVNSWGLGLSNLEIILPVGISFFTFQTMSYTIDIYRRKLKPVTSFGDFALFVAFFPQLVAGPIVRATEFLPQLDKQVRIRASNVWAGSQIFIVGLFKKLMIADSVAPLVDNVYGYPGYYSSFTVWLAVIAYAIQIYADFSGYSDMAIGCARILGFRFNQNFNMPYLSRDVSEFWRRWHISLSTWLRDYLYISLGGNRSGEIRTYLNLMITMVLGGLWHGASWNFVIWGFAHGVALCGHRMWRAWRGQQKSKTVRTNRTTSLQSTVLQPTVYAIVSTVATFLFVSLIWVLFRAQDTATSIAIYRKLFLIDSSGAQWGYVFAYSAIAWCAIGHLIGTLRKESELIFFSSPFSFRAAFVVSTTLLVIYIFAPTNVSPFIYFQF